MSPPGHPKGECRSPKDEGPLMCPPGRPKGEYRSPKYEGPLMSPPGRPKGEYRSPWDGRPIPRVLAKSPMITSGQSPLPSWRLA